MKLSSKLSLLTRFGVNLANLYLIGHLIFVGSQIISAMAVVMFLYLLAKSAVMVIYIQWRYNTGWTIEWKDEDEHNYS